MAGSLSPFDDHHLPIRQLGKVLTITFGLLAVGILAGFLVISAYVHQADQAARQWSLLDDHRAQTLKIALLTQAIDDQTPGEDQQALISRMSETIAQASDTYREIARTFTPSLAPQITQALQRASPPLDSFQAYDVLFRRYLAQAQTYLALHKSNDQFTLGLGAHQFKLIEGASGPLATYQQTLIEMARDHDAARLRLLWILDTAVLCGLAICLGVAGGLVLRRLFRNTATSIEQTEDARNRLATIIDSVEDCILELDGNGNAVFANRSARRTLGLTDPTLSQVSLKNLTQFAGHDGRALQTALQTREYCSGRSVLISQIDGTCFRAATTLAPLNDRQGGILTFHDMTHHLQREERLRKLSHAVEFSPMLVIITDSTGIIEYVNPAFSTLSGWDAAEVVGRSPRVISSGQQDPKTYRVLWQTLRKGNSWRGEFRNRRKDGTDYWVRCSIAPIKDDREQITHFVAVQEDITTEYFALREMETSRRRLREAVTSLKHGFAIYDRDSRLTMCNSTYSDMHGNDGGAVAIGRVFEEIIRIGAENGCYELDNTSHDIDVFVADRMALFTSGGTQEIPMAGDRWILATETLTPSGEHVCLRTDITELKTIQKELETARTTADRANAAKTQFLSSMSHELRTPLNAILGFAQLLQMNRKTPLSDRQNDHVQQILGAGHHLLTLIDEILDLAKIESGRVTLSLQPVEVRTVIRDCHAMIQPAADTAGLAFRVDDLDSLDGLWVKADYTRLKQVLLNLLSNAVKYNSPHGTLWLEVRQPPVDGDIPSSIEFRVRDTGIGIPADHRKDLFKPFNRLGREQTTIEGTGIGLALTKQLVSFMGGMLTMTDNAETPETEIATGTTFTVSLPAAQPSARVLALGRARDSGQRKAGEMERTTSDLPTKTKPALGATGMAKELPSQLSGRILVIDLRPSQAKDSTASASTGPIPGPGMTDMLATLQGRAPDLEVLPCSTVDDGLQSLSQRAVNVIAVALSPRQPPDLEQACRIVTDQALPAIPVIALVDEAPPSLTTLLRRKGFAAVLRNSPDSVNALIAHLDALLQTHADKDKAPRLSSS